MIHTWTDPAPAPPSLPATVFWAVISSWIWIRYPEKWSGGVGVACVHFVSQSTGHEPGNLTGKIRFFRNHSGCVRTKKVVWPPALLL